MIEFVVAGGLMAGIGVTLAALLAFADKKLYVYEDPRIDAVEKLLPKANCGACGQPGCRAFAEKAVNGEFVFNAHPEADAHQYHQVALTLFCAVDLPLSFVGDVITWPYTASYTFINSPVPTPPVIQASDSPPPQMTFDGGVKTAPIETLPEPKKLP